MSDYVRIKAVRYKMPQNAVEYDENYIDIDAMCEKYGINYHRKSEINKFVIDCGFDFENDKEDCFLDFLLDYEYGASGDFESVRLLTDKEFEKYANLFATYFEEIGRDELRLVHYSYYNGVDEPSVYEIEEI